MNETFLRNFLKDFLHNFLAASTLLFQVHLVGLERPSITNQAITFIHFAVWPIGLFGIVYYLYKKISDAAKEDRKGNGAVQGGEAKKRQAGTGKAAQGKKPQLGGSNRAA